MYKEILKEILMIENVVESIKENSSQLFSIIPELKAMVNFPHRHPHHHLNVWNHTLLALSMSPKDFEVRLALLLHDMGKPFCYQDEEVRHFRGHPKKSAEIVSIFLDFVGLDDVYTYSIDESFLDISSYLNLYKMNPKQIALMIIQDIFKETGITATAGIGTNLFLSKIALDIMAKHAEDYIAYLDEDIFKQTLWYHTPLTDFWMIGPGTVKRLNALGIQNLYGVAHYPEKDLYKTFGVNAEYLIDHSWGKEPTTIADIKNYVPQANSISNSQILFEDYSYDDAYLVMKEMVDINVLTLIERHLVTNHISLFIGYSKDIIPPSRVSRQITNTTNSCRVLLDEFKRLYKIGVNPNYPIRHIAISFGNVKNELYEQFDLFTDPEDIEKEKRIQQTILSIHHKYGKNSVLKGMNYLKRATAKKRNTLVGGHNAD